MLGTLWIYAAVSLTAAVAAVLVQSVWQLLRRSLRSDLPPGPRGFPFLGYLPFMLKDGHWEVDALRKKYGNIFGLHLGSRYVVFLCDFDSVKEALSHDALLYRPAEFPLSSNPQESLITLNGPVWEEQRRFFVKMFKRLGAGTPLMEAHVQKEFSHLLSELNALNGDPVTPLDVLSGSVSNILTTLLVSRRFGQDHPQRAYLDDFIEVVVALSAQVMAVNFFPWLRSLLSCLGLGACGSLRDGFLRRTRFTEQLVREVERSHQEDIVRNFSDGFMFAMKNPPEGNKTFTRNLLVGNVASFIGGGTGTMCTALVWLLVMCAAKQDQQDIVRAEIDSVMKDKEPGSRITWNDRRKMPYTQAFIRETMRCKPVNPLALMRCARADVKLAGYFVPRGSIIIPSFSSLFNDRSFWKDPEVFSPERFLTNDGQSVTKPKWFIPFSLGRRSCPGEFIADMVVFVYFANIVHNFNIEATARGVRLNDEVLGITMRPKPRKLVFRPRKHELCQET